MTAWIDRVCSLAAAHGRVVRATVIGARGPTPREIGASMLVTAGGLEGTIGRGGVEATAVAKARGMIGADHPAAAAWMRQTCTLPLGPVLGVPSGGSIDILLEQFTPVEAAALTQLQAAMRREHAMLAARPLSSGAPLRLASSEELAPLAPDLAAAARELETDPLARLRLIASARDGETWLVERVESAAVALFLHGGGHVARALVRVLDGLPFAVTWIRADAQQWPEPVPPYVHPIASTDPIALAASAPPGAFHVVMTADHELDLAICRAVLAAGRPGYLGVIGSRMKRERLLARLAADGIDEARLASVSCPIGVPGIAGKAPAVIAVSIAAELLARLSQR